MNISTDNIDLPSDVQFKRNWMKKVRRHFERVPHWATEHVHSQHQREEGLSCMPWWAQSLVMAWSTRKASGPKAAWKQTASQVPDRHTEISDQPHTPDRCQPVLTWMTSRIGPKTALQNDEKHQILYIFLLLIREYVSVYSMALCFSTLAEKTVWTYIWTVRTQLKL